MHKLVPSNSEILNKPLETFDFSNPPEDPKKIAEILLEHVKEYKGIGLSANQIGLPYRVFILVGNPSMVCFNPRIVSSGNNVILTEEGCLTFPGLYVRIKRPEEVRVRYVDENGETQTRQLTGLTSRCFQHELDHLDGIDYTKRASKYHLDQAKRKMKYFKRKLKDFDLSPRKMYEGAYAE